jgi:hypothetical protein
MLPCRTPPSAEGRGRGLREVLDSRIEGKACELSQPSAQHQRAEAKRTEGPEEFLGWHPFILF